MEELTNDIIDESCNLKNKNELFINIAENTRDFSHEMNRTTHM